MRILLIEDDAIVGDALVKSLGRDRADVVWSRDGLEAEAMLRGGGFDLVVLDLGLPGQDGLSLLRGLRGRGDVTPVLVLTARDGVEDRIRGLDHGADDYLLKPFDTGELLARCRALLRRAQGRSENLLSWNGLTLDTARMTGLRGGREIAFARREFGILQALMERPGAILGKPQLEERLYGWQEDVESNTVEVHIHHLRAKLGSGFIRTVRGAGYALG